MTGSAAILSPRRLANGLKLEELLPALHGLKHRRLLKLARMPPTTAPAHVAGEYWLFEVGWGRVRGRRGRAAVGANLGAVCRIFLGFLLSALTAAEALALAPSEVSGQPSEVSGQPSEVSGQPSEVSGQPSELSKQPTASAAGEATQPIEPLEEPAFDRARDPRVGGGRRQGLESDLGVADNGSTGSKLDAELRFRGSKTAYLGNSTAGQDAVRSGFFDRMRLGANFVSPNVTAYMQLQASGAFGDSGVNLSPLPIGLQQGVIQLRLPGVKNLDLNVGRMALEFGAGRMIGRYDFHETGHAFDGIDAHLGIDKVLDLHAIVVKIRRNSAQPDYERSMGGIYLQTTPIASLQADVYFLYLIDNKLGEAGKPNEKDRLLTMGARIGWQPAHWLEFEGEAAVQVGEFQQEGQLDRQDLLATALVGQLTLKRQGHLPQRLSMYGQMYSGDAKPTDRVLTTWKPLYPSVDEVVGLLQLVNQTNLLQVGLRYRAQLFAQMSAEVDARSFASEGGATLPGFGEKFLSLTPTWHTVGAELDLRLRWQWRPRTEFLLAAGTFAPSDALVALGQRLAGQVLLQWSSKF